nr:hypothetical protein [Tanacetum cinerariifolium]
MGEGSALPSDPQHTPTILQPSSSQPQKTQKHRKPKRKNTQVTQPSGSTKHVADEAVYKELDDKLVRVATTASSLEKKQDNGNIDKTQSKETPNEASSLGTTLGGGLKCQEAMEDTIAQTRFENVSKLSNDSLLARGNTLQSDKDNLKLNELMELCTNLQSMVLGLEKKKTTQALEITSLKRRVKKIEKKQRSRTHKLKRLYKVGLTARVDSSEDDQSLDDAEMFDVNDLHDEEVFIEKEVANKEVNVAGEVNVASIVTTVSAAKRRKFFAAKAVEEKRNKPPTQAQQRKIMCTYLTNIEGKKLKDLKNKSFDSIQKMFDKAFNRVNTFVDFRTELVEGSSKRAREELTQKVLRSKRWMIKKKQQSLRNE